MKAKEHILSDAEHIAVFDLTCLDIPNDRNKEIMDFFDSINDFYPFTKKNIWVVNHKGMEENKYNKPIPLHRIGLLSENFKRIKYFNKNIN